MPFVFNDFACHIFYEQLSTWSAAEIIQAALQVAETESSGFDKQLKTAQSILSKRDRGLTIKQVRWLAIWIAGTEAARVEAGKPILPGLKPPPRYEPARPDYEGDCVSATG